MDSIHPDIICLQETWLPHNQPVKLANYQSPPARKDRPEGARGGVCVFTRLGIPCLLVPVLSDLEVCAVRICLPSHSLTIVSLYIPPAYNTGNLTRDMDLLLPQLPCPFFICADVNAHHFSWGSPYNDRRGKLLDAWITNADLILLNTGEPTYTHANGTLTHIDVTISTPDLATCFAWHPFSDTFSSDHFPIVVDSNIPTPTAEPLRRWLLNSADWSGYEADLTLPTAKSFCSPTQACRMVEAEIMKSAKLNVKTSGKPKTRKHCKPWWTPACQAAANAKARARNRYDRHLGNLELWIAYKKANAISLHTQREAKAQSWNTFISSINSRTRSSDIWARLRMLKHSRPRRTIIFKVNDTVVSQTKDVANVLACQYSRRSSGHSPDVTFSDFKTASEQKQISFSLHPSIFTGTTKNSHSQNCAVPLHPQPQSLRVLTASHLRSSSTSQKPNSLSSCHSTTTSGRQVLRCSGVRLLWCQSSSQAKWLLTLNLTALLH